MDTIAFIGTPAHGHVNPSRSVVREVRQRGARVIYYCSDEFRTKIAQTGVEFRSFEELGMPPHMLEYSPRQARNAFTLAALSAEGARVLTPLLVDALRADGVELVVHDALSTAGVVAANVLQLPAVCFVPSFAFGIRVSATSLRLAGELCWSLFEDFGALRRARRASRQLSREIGHPFPSIIQAYTNRQPLNIVCTARALQPRADLFDDSFKFVGPTVFDQSEPSDLPWERFADRRVLYISLGSVFNDRPEFYRDCFEAFGDSPYEVILSTGHRVDGDVLGTAPKNFTVRPHVPQVEVLRHTHLFLTHGGMNSVSEALVAKVPVLVIPQALDQMVVAAQVVRLGLGTALGKARVTPSRLRRAVARAEAERSAQLPRIETMAESLAAAGGAARAADEILAYMRCSRAAAR